MPEAPFPSAAVQRMIGVILGSAFDRAIMLVLRNWKIVVTGWIVIGCATVFDRTPHGAVLNLVWLASYPIQAAIACSSLDADFKLSGRLVFRLFVSGIIWLAATIGLVSTVVAFTLPRIVDATGTTFAPGSAGYLLLDVAAAAMSIWIGTKWSMAPTLVIYERQAVAASFGRSWNLTTICFWQTLGFNAAVTIAGALVYLGPYLVASSVIKAFFHPAVDASRGIIASFIVPLEIYAGIASWLAYISWLQWLEARP